ncbi:APC family permease [Pseudoclavibacter sp. 13-3]|uniref:APC family permease n=1 Tax=Pseudoclavibacter sp. 13-3 TaxID=2901228 RepID=UPI001E4126F2|nr:APC family permease [Pseudoclavibacter sp. 13-3]MCD7101340.1 APC family permease [Pseudoclavibacter sp. 13-3]
MTFNKPASTASAASTDTGEISARRRSRKGLGKGTVGLLGAMVIGISCIAPAYTLTGALGPTVSVVGTHLPAVFIVGFLPMLLTAFGYKELNRHMPDSGTSFTWATRAFGPWVGWMAGWGLIVATVVVLSNLAGIAVDFFYLALSQIVSNPEIADLTRNPVINVITCLVFIAIAMGISYRDMQTTQRFQYLLVGFQLLVMLLFGGMAFWHFFTGTAFDATPITLDSFNPFGVESFSAFAGGISLSLFIFWGWDVILTMNEETKDSSRTPGRAATITIVFIIVLYLFLAISLISYAGIGEEGYGLNNPESQENVFFALAGPVLGPLAILVSLAVLTSSAASLQSTAVGPARTLLSMGHYGALPKRFAKVHPKYMTPGFATIVSGVVAAVFYTVMRFLSEAVLWDTITTLGMMICFYYGLTALSCVWYFRRQWFASVHNFFQQFLFPLIGGVVLVVLFFVTLIDSMDPEYGSGSSIGGIGLVFILGLVLILSGVVVMIWRYVKDPAFFRGSTLKAGLPGDAAEAELQG